MVSRMREVLNELRRIGNALEKIGGALVPTFDPGILDRYRAFSCVTQNGVLGLKGISNPDPVSFSELVGIDDTISAVAGNTEQFLSGLPSNNVLLYGPRGTGKSSVIKAALNRYAVMGLKMVEMPRDTLRHILDLAGFLRDRDGQFIIFCDDLSFEDNEQSYRSIRTVLEGGLQARPANMLIYATSNRRHLMSEKSQDNLPAGGGGELHPEEAREERLALSDRFGLRLGMQYFDMETYLKIVENYAKLGKIRMNKSLLRREAMQWSLDHGSFSGRTARQFIDSLQGRIGLKKTPLHGAHIGNKSADKRLFP